MNNGICVLVVEDDPRILDVLEKLLSANGYQILTAENGQIAVSMISSHCPDMVLLDLGLPELSGLAVLRQIRPWYGKPVIVVSAHGHEQEKVAALDLGADDYITKPFGASELLARMRTALRHRNVRETGDEHPEGQYSTGGFLIDYDLRKVFVDSEEIHLTAVEYNIVELISRHHGHVLTYDYILKTLWGPYWAPDNNKILRVNMVNIRRKIEKPQSAPRYILTEIGVGYRMATDETEE